MQAIRISTKEKAKDIILEIYFYRNYRSTSNSHIIVK